MNERTTLNYQQIHKMFKITGKLSISLSFYQELIVSKAHKYYSGVY